MAPVAGRYFENTSPITGGVICEVARSDAQDIERALDAAHAAKEAWGRTAPAERALILTRIADRMQENLDLIALAETWDNGKPIRETTHADIPLAIDHFRYFAPAASGRRRARSPRSTTTRSPTTSTSRSASSARSSRGTSRS